MDKYEKDNNSLILRRNSILYKKSLTSFELNGNKFEIVVGGKVDGIDKDGNIVETKNRRYKLFDSIPIYEKVQMETYMWLTNKNKCIHIQNFNENQVKNKYNSDKELFEKVKSNSVKFFIKMITDKNLSLKRIRN